MNFEELNRFADEVARPKMLKILEKTEIPEGLCCIDNLTLEFLDGRSIGTGYHIQADGLVFRNGQVDAFSYDEFDVSVGEFAHLMRNCVLMSDGLLKVHDELREVEVSTKFWNMESCIQMFAQMEPLEELKIVADYLPYLKMKQMYEALSEAAALIENPFDVRVQDVLNQIDSGRITGTANAVLCFDHKDGERVVCVDFCYDTCEDLPECDVVNLMTLPATDENVKFAQAVLQGIAEGWKVPVHDESMEGQEGSRGTKADVMKVYEDLLKLQESPEYQVAAVMAHLDEHCEPDVALTDDEMYVLAEKFVKAAGSWFGTTASQQEYLIALGDLLENGITAHNGPEFHKLGVMETRKLLLEADNQVFGTLVEAATVNNCYRYLPDDYELGQEDVDVVERAIERELVEDIGGLIGETVQRSCSAEGLGKRKEELGTRERGL